MSNLTIREARPMDKSSVKNLVDYREREMDPMISKFDDYLSNKFRFHFLAEIEGVVVSFVGVKVVDGGRTAYMYGAKTHPDYRGQGIQTKLQTHALRLVKGKFPEIERVTLNTALPTYDDEYFRKTTRETLLHKQKMVCVSIRTEDFVTRILPNWRLLVKPSLHEVETEKIASEVFGKVDFEAGFCQVNYHFFRPVKDNDEIIQELVEKAYIGRDGEAMSFSTLSVFPKCEGFYLKTRYDINITCKTTQHGIEHVIRHLEYILQKETARKSADFELYVRSCAAMDHQRIYDMFHNPATEAIVTSSFNTPEYWTIKLVEFPALVDE